MNLLDIGIVVIVGYGLIRGIFRGLIKELSSIIGVLAAYWAAYSFYPQVADALVRWISDRAYLNIVSFLIIFLAVFLAVSILGVVIKYLLNIAFLGWIDRICGAAFGVLKGVLIVSVVLVILTAFLKDRAPLVRESRLAPYVTTVSENLAKVVPKDMKQQFFDKLRSLKREWNIP